MKSNKEMRVQGEKRSFFSRKGMAGYFILLSILGIFIGAWILLQGIQGKSISPMFAVLLGIFMIIKETLDIFH